METGIYFPPSIQRFEPKRVVFSTWIDHICFAYDLVAAIRPKLIVELGVYNGLSYFTFCQSMVENDIDGVAYGIDCWEGDEHTDAYDDSIYEDCAEHARDHWYPKLKPGGILLFHDVMAKIKDFGAWKFFEDLEREHEETFKFNHGYGLGVLRKPGGERESHSLLDMMFSGDEETEKRLRQFYVHAGVYLEARRQAAIVRERRKGKKLGGDGKLKQQVAEG